MLTDFGCSFDTSRRYELVSSAYVRGCHYFACGENGLSDVSLDLYRDGMLLVPDSVVGGGMEADVSVAPIAGPPSSSSTSTSSSSSKEPRRNTKSKSTRRTTKVVGSADFALLTALDFVPGFDFLLLAGGFSHGGVSLYYTDQLECILSFSVKPGLLISAFGFTGVAREVDDGREGASSRGTSSSSTSAAAPPHQSIANKEKYSARVLDENGLFWIVHNHVDTEALHNRQEQVFAARQQQQRLLAEREQNRSPILTTVKANSTDRPTGGYLGTSGGGPGSGVDEMNQNVASTSSSARPATNPLFDDGIAGINNSRTKRTGSDASSSSAASRTISKTDKNTTAAASAAGATAGTRKPNFGAAASPSTGKYQQHHGSSTVPQTDGKSYVVRIPFACVRQAVKKAFPVPSYANFKAEVLEFPVDQVLTTTVFSRRDVLEPSTFSPHCSMSFFNSNASQSIYVTDLAKAAEQQEKCLTSAPGGGAASTPSTTAPSTPPYHQECRNQIVVVGQNPFLAKCDNMYTPKSQATVTAAISSAMDYFMGRWGGGGATGRSTPRIRFDPLKQSARDRVSAGFHQSAEEVQYTERVEEYCLSPSAQLEDGGRRAVACAYDSGSKYLLIADNLGRVGLYCFHSLRCIHLWRGYREAQVAFLSPAYAAILATRRCLLEVWDLGTLKRVRAWNLANNATIKARNVENENLHDEILPLIPNTLVNAFPRLITTTRGHHGGRGSGSFGSEVLLLRKKRNGKIVLHKVNVPDGSAVGGANRTTSDASEAPRKTSSSQDDILEFDSAQEDEGA